MRRSWKSAGQLVYGPCCIVSRCNRPPPPLRELLGPAVLPDAGPGLSQQPRHQDGGRGGEAVVRLPEPSAHHQHHHIGPRGRQRGGGTCVYGMCVRDGAISVCVCVCAALVPGGRGQQPLRDVHGGVRPRRVAGAAGERPRPAVPRSDPGEPDGGGRGAGRAQDARR